MYIRKQFVEKMLIKNYSATNLIFDE